MLTSFLSAGVHHNIKTIVVMLFSVYVFSNDRRPGKADRQLKSSEWVSVKRGECVYSFFVLRKTEQMQMACKHNKNIFKLLLYSIIIIITMSSKFTAFIYFACFQLLLSVYNKSAGLSNGQNDMSPPSTCEPKLL